MTGCGDYPANEKLLAAIVGSSDDAIIAKDLRGTVLVWNRAAERLFGYTAADMLGQPITRIFPSDRVPEEALLLARIAAGERVDHYETVRCRQDGSTFDVSVTISPIRDETGHIIGASKILRDLTERNAYRRRIAELQAELAHVQRLNEMGQMVSTLVHEVNQPLTAINNYAAASRRLIADTGQEKLRSALDHIVTQTTRTSEIVGRIGAYVRRRDLTTRSERLDTVIDEAIALTETANTRAHLDLSVHVEPRGLRVLIDKIQVQQVLFNLIRNAIEAMPDQVDQNIDIAAKPTAADMVEVSVSDRGHGLADEIRSKLFQPFLTTKPNGMGVGLSVCRTIVESHAGRLWAEDNPGGGTIFRFTLPEAAMAAANV